MIATDFLLSNSLARRLYHECAAPLPIVDYHCHLDPVALAEDRRFENVGQLWVAPDPYKHRAMRILGVPERFITGNASDRETFDCWAATVPQTAGNPLYHWTALELKRHFDINSPLSPDTASFIWDTCNERLHSAEFSARQFLRKSNGTGVTATHS
jgi:glucuronate isomerase